MEQVVDNMSYPTCGSISVHMVDKFIVLHDVHPMEEFLPDHFGYGKIVLAISTNLSQTNSWSFTEGSQERFLKPIVNVF